MDIRRGQTALRNEWPEDQLDDGLCQPQHLQILQSDIITGG
jgi:hypothetical protein